MCRRTVRVAGYRIASKCFYALLFRCPRGEKYRNNSVWIEELGSSIASGPSPPRGATALRALVNKKHVGLYVGS